MVCDIIIILFMILTFFFGWKKGFVRSAYSIISLIICIAAMYFFRAPITQFLADTEWGMELGNLITSSHIAFAADECIEAILSVAATAVVYFASKIILQFVFRVLDSLTALPLIHGFNQILGLLVNGIVGIIWIVILINLFYMLPQTREAVLESRIVEEFGMIFVS